MGTFFYKSKRAYSKYISTSRLFNAYEEKDCLKAHGVAEMSPFSQRRPAPRTLERSELLEASMWIAARWFDRFVCSSDRATDTTELVEFGGVEANLAEAVVLDQGADFVFPKWGAALGTLCGGDHRGATAAQMPEAEQATWVVDGRIWQCAMLALPTAGNELSATRLLVAVLFAPHPMFADSLIPNHREGHPGLTTTLATQTIFPNP